MLLTLGEYALAGSMLTALAITLACIAFLRSQNEGLLRAARAGIALLALLLVTSAAALLQALLADNFTLAYVMKHSERALHWAYKSSAFWAGQEGSLLFWALLLGLMSALMAFRGRKQNTSEQAVSLATMALITGFFTAVMLFAGNPFDRTTLRSANGEGLNPMLQNVAMAIHPPMLFLGYAGFAAPFALLMGALATGKKDLAWLREARTWMVYSWLTLTVGIVLGAWWAYMELGWGGYWAWDPVENASLLPWLTGTALLHSAILALRRGIFKRWTASLTALSFFLCIFGTYLTRSGVIQSVHSFGESPIGTFFLIFLGVIFVASIAAILLRLNCLSAEHELDEFFTREGFFLLGNVLLVIMTLITLFGTVSPIFTGANGGTAITINAAFYNKVVLPLALVLAALMATGPVLGSNAGAALRAAPKLVLMATAGLVAVIIVLFTHLFSPWILAATFVITAISAGVAIDIFLTIKSQFSTGLPAVLRALALRHRHWGAQFAHLGLAAIIAGVAGSAVYGVTNNVQLKPPAADGTKTTGTVGPYTLELKNFDEARRDNHNAVIATVLITDAQGHSLTLAPERRFYDRGTEPGQSSAEVALQMGLSTDIYLTLAGWDQGGSTVTVSAIINPLVSWIWIGGALLTLGGLVCLIPSGNPAHLPAIESTTPDTSHMTARERRRAHNLQPALTRQ